MYYNQQPGNNVMQEITENLKLCSYQYLNDVQKSCYQIVNVYPRLKPVRIQQSDGNFARSLLELQGNVEIKYKNNSYHIVTHVLFPFLYPTAPILIKIKNIDPSKFIVNQKYMAGLQQDGTVYLQLSEVQNWSLHRDPIKLLKQMERELGTTFPFYAKSNQPQQNQNQYQQQQYGQQQYNQPQSNYNQNYNQNYNNQQQPVNPLGNQNYQHQNNSGNQVISQKLNQEVEQISQKLKSDCKELKQQLDDIYNAKSTLDSQEIQLEQTQLALNEKSQNISKEIQELQIFKEQNDQNTLNAQNIDDYVKEQDPLSEQIISLVAENKSIEETLMLIENLYSSDKIDLNKLLDMVRSYSEKEFFNKQLLKKCIDSNKN